MADADGDIGRAAGWVALGRAAVVDDPIQQVESAQRAVDVARAYGDTELEVLALARLGWARVVTGSVDNGVDLFDEAMAAVTTAEFDHLSTLGDRACSISCAWESCASLVFGSVQDRSPR
jgi:hypothetical protein